MTKHNLREVWLPKAPYGTRPGTPAGEMFGSKGAVRDTARDTRVQDVRAQGRRTGHGPGHPAARCSGPRAPYRTGHGPGHPRARCLGPRAPYGTRPGTPASKMFGSKGAVPYGTRSGTPAGEMFGSKGGVRDTRCSCPKAHFRKTNVANVDVNDAYAEHAACVFSTSDTGEKCRSAHPGHARYTTKPLKTQRILRMLSLMLNVEIDGSDFFWAPRTYYIRLRSIFSDWLGLTARKGNLSQM